ncbi:phosphoribosylamine/glycine ligase [Fimbriimonas ginsengisoli Gsoil 348]|uniref:Phosphoribosylamine--glycine ligase n=2 Tax=Fimbriimonas ginsengisoli TaxID=1005039 RepID=A0A068NTP2_FIMGI|nr:phosphoribosylamine/glycine ligase [Fimbriimonas ginsengisoli Gsoil 348]
MRILVVGGGGREHALAWKLAQEAEVLCAPGNPGIAGDVECVPVRQDDFAGLLELCRHREVDLVVVGPEDPLIAGLGSFLREHGITVYGPGKQAAQLEGSKAFSKELMFEAGIPTAEFLSFHDPNEAKTYVRERFANGRQVAVKASGNALGKGVVVCETELEAEEAIDQMMVQRIFGDAGSVVVIEDRLRGPEFSLLTIVGDEHFVSLPIAQDHKQAFDGDKGPNTGGMGAYSPVDWVTSDMVAETEERVVAPALRRLRERGILYRGTLFSGLMMDEGQIYCLEYNVRFGDPEIETLVLRLGFGFANALYEAALGHKITPPEVLRNAAVSVFVASGGYPGSIRKGLPIELGRTPEGAKLFHAGTAEQDGKLVTNGGRVVAACASGATFEEARRLAYLAAEGVRFEGAFYRSDIGLRP